MTPSRSQSTGTGSSSAADGTPEKKDAAVRMQASAFSTLPSNRQGMVESLNTLKEDGSSKLWNTFRLAPRAVSLRELCQSTKLDAKVRWLMCVQGC